MSVRHLAFWPVNQQTHLTVPQTNVFYNAEVSARRFPDKPCILFYGTSISFSRFRDEATAIAGYLQQQCGVKAGDRVLLYMQNSVQWVLAYYGILRANAVVVPVNPMNRTDELRHYVTDTGASVAFAPQDLLNEITPMLDTGLRHIIVATYSDYLEAASPVKVPDFVAAPRIPLQRDALCPWHRVLEAKLQPGPLTAGPDDLCVMPYTSGTTGHPKGCMHTHRSVMYSLVSGMQWFNTQQDAVILSTLPYFHVTGMQGSMSGPLYAGATLVMLPRWDRESALQLIAHHRVTSMQMITAMVVDLLSHPRLAEHDLSSVRGIRGGGAAMPEAIAQKMQDLLGLRYVEGYGMSETMAATHINPTHRPKQQCLGIPMYDVDSRVIDPVTLAELGTGEVGEIIVNAPNVMLGYWNHPEAQKESFIDIDGKRFLRTGDIGLVDEDGYFFMRDRIKRMINASGFKVWPAEVEALLYKHPAIREACVIGARDAKRGETVKAVVVLKEDQQGQVSEADIAAWAHEHMAAYKAPRVIEFVDALPKSPSGKVLWRQLQEEENSKPA